MGNKPFKSIGDFRARATYEDAVELAEFLKKQKNKQKSLPNSDYDFSYKSAYVELKKTWHINVGRELRTGHAVKMPAEGFIIRAGEMKVQGETKFTSRTISFQKDILDRIDKLASENWQYSKKAIINKLLDEALSRYDY